ncbi:MAG: hypothetical protein ACTSWA_11025 [Candidatus Thorarchaeota archaeon]
MIGRRKLFLLGLFVTILFTNQPITVDAHTPALITLEYDFDLQELTVTISHSVSDINTHYIYEIVVEKNSVLFTTESYTSQSSTSGMSDTISVPAVDGDILSATAKCSISGQISGQVTVVDPTTTSSSTTTSTSTTTTDTSSTELPIQMTTIILVGIVVLGIVVVILGLIRRR